MDVHTFLLLFITIKDIQCREHYYVKTNIFFKHGGVKLRITYFYENVLTQEVDEIY